MASGLSISGTTYNVGTTSVSIIVPHDQTSVGSMYTTATRYRYPRATTNIGIGSLYRGKTFNRLQYVGALSTRLTGTTTISVNWGLISWTSGNIIIGATNSNFGTQNPLGPDGYEVYMDTASSTTATISVGTALYGGTFSGWRNQSNTLISTGNPFSWNGLATATSLYAYWT
jgi:hypothetical protein